MPVDVKVVYAGQREVVEVVEVVYKGVAWGNGVEEDDGYALPSVALEVDVKVEGVFFQGLGCLVLLKGIRIGEVGPVVARGRELLRPSGGKAEVYGVLDDSVVFLSGECAV